MSKSSLLTRSLIAGGASALVIAASMVKPLEGIEYVPYYDVAGVLTVCYGTTGPDVIQGQAYTQEECDYFLERDLARVKSQIEPLIKPVLPEPTKAALYSFTYNVGAGAFSRSTLLQKLNNGDINDACDELKRWVYAGGQKWRGLMTRREIEEEVCKLAFKSTDVKMMPYVSLKDERTHVDSLEIHNPNGISAFSYH
ncbi:glycoside hydrolase family protein [Vibrio sp. V31_P5A7T61]|uniref:lysozyme n=1 Tax=unclassified Vibrio TaxID=2614977 RepID=UPI0013732BA8|nr:glycoside hydrolase family protein [Vibrio sp. V31_P5A7T61]NAX01427.1 glycoside hydrolase family protein [Vibrio sp. V34_P3A8T189]NAX07218.1 glycoside hydrolase family protein [Vibrio sp. V40_P2S30T141]NAX63810.1 glycoside hydrolase family protein [Vibrio sp. V32_P6A28T40]